MELQSLKDERLLLPWNTRRWFQNFLFSSLHGEMIQFDKYFSGGLKPPTRISLRTFQAWRHRCARRILQDFVRQDGGSTSGYVERLAAQLVLVLDIVSNFLCSWWTLPTQGQCSFGLNVQLAGCQTVSESLSWLNLEQTMEAAATRKRRRKTKTRARTRTTTRNKQNKKCKKTHFAKQAELLVPPKKRQPTSDTCCRSAGTMCSTWPFCIWMSMGMDFLALMI